MAKEFAIRIVEAKDKEQSQGEMEERTSTKEGLSDKSELCSKKQKNLIEENSKSYLDETEQIKGSIAGIPKKIDSKGALELIEKEKEVKNVENFKPKKNTKVRRLNCGSPKHRDVAKAHCYFLLLLLFLRSPVLCANISEKDKCVFWSFMKN